MPVSYTLLWAKYNMAHKTASITRKKKAAVADRVEVPVDNCENLDITTGSLGDHTGNQHPWVDLDRITLMADSETDRQRERQTETETERERKRLRQTEADRERETEKGRKTDRQTK